MGLIPEDLIKNKLRKLLDYIINYYVTNFPGPIPGGHAKKEFKKIVIFHFFPTPACHVILLSYETQKFCFVELSWSLSLVRIL